MLTVDKEPQIRALIAQLFTAGSNDGGQPLAISIDLATSIDFSCAGRKTFRNFDISGEIQPKIVPVGWATNRRLSPWPSPASSPA